MRWFHLPNGNWLNLSAILDVKVFGSDVVASSDDRTFILSSHDNRKEAEAELVKLIVSLQRVV